MEKKIVETKTEWVGTCNRFVGFLDILGFKDLVMRKSHEDIYTLLNEISKLKTFLVNAANDDVITKKIKDAEIHIVNFSDSIVIFSKNDSLDNFRYFLVAIRHLFKKAIEKGIPLKGGLAHGKISLDKEEQIYFGQPIIDAYLIEEDVNYLGLVAHNSIDHYLDVNNFPISKIHKAIFEAKSPLKSGSITHLNINWFKLVLSSKELDEDAALVEIKKLINRFKLSVSGSPRRYLDNTFDFFEKNLKNGEIKIK